MLIYVGVVEDNVDPKRQARIKVRVMGVFDQIPTEDIPWASPFNSTDGKSFHTPPIGKLVSVIFVKNNLYSPYYIDAENYNINLKDRLDDMDDDDYKNFSALLYDHRTQIYSNNKEFKIDYYYNNIVIDKESINFDLKDNNQKINIGDREKSTQQALFGNHWLDWFDKFVQELLVPMSLIGNTGGPILKTKLDQLLIEYQQIRPTFISNNIFLVDNFKVKEDPDKHKRDYETKVETHDIDLTFNNTNIIDTQIGDTIACNAASEQNNITEMNSTDADPEDLEIGMIDCEGMKEKIKNDVKKEKTKEKSKSNGETNYFNNNPYVDKDAVTDEETKESNCDDFKEGINYNAKISNHYTLGQLSSNAVVSKYKIKSQKGLSESDIACNLKNIATDVLDKIKDKYPSMIVTSGFRQGNGTSQHYKGEAVDMQFTDKRNKDYKDISLWIKDNVPHDQLLLEYKNKRSKKAWIHISYKKSGNRNMELTLFNDSTRQPGGNGLIDLSGSYGIPV